MNKPKIILVIVVVPLFVGLIWLATESNKEAITEEIITAGEALTAEDRTIQVSQEALVRAYEIKLRTDGALLIVNQIIEQLEKEGEFTITKEDKTYILIEKPQ